ncbi:hypothetical protein B0H16DRAFT_1685894 [Mycena metata]|uniref:PROP1-like PPR domain-containing protein n=1 Tax=Mycena metata TaxID=1033252 RepID=A0AAD7JRX0_9AGAR|nr:hypothetical protein B0H16DRAFT_1685894 [Mycena metata]
MLPKVATTLLHSSGRAVAAVQTQTHTIRNVLHSSTSASSSPGGQNPLAPWTAPSSSSHGNNGKHTGSRFYSGYNGAGRAVTQANAITSQDGGVAQADDTEELPVRRVPIIRSRSHSLSTSRSEKPSVLKTVKLHARAFASLVPQEATSSVPIPVLVRRNSTSSTDGEPFVAAPPNARAPSPRPDPVDPAAPQTVEPPTILSLSPVLRAIHRARESEDPVQVADAVRQLVEGTSSPSVREYNEALSALRETRRPGDSLVLLMQTYNAMLRHGLMPNLRTYVELMTAITDRDHEISTTITSLEARARRGQGNLTDPQRIEQLRAENTFDSAMKLFETVNTTDGAHHIPLHLYTALLRSCANHARPEAALHIFNALEQRPDLLPTAPVYKHMLRAYSSPDGITDAETIFDDFVSRSAAGTVDWSPTAYGAPPPGRYQNVRMHQDQAAPRRQHLQVYNQMIEAYFRVGLSDKAVGLLESMMRSIAPSAFGPADVPRPGSSTYTTVIAGFINTGDIDTALAWFRRLLNETAVARAPYESHQQALRPDAVAWQTMLDALALDGRIDDLNALFLELVQCASRDGLVVRDADRQMVYLANIARLPRLDDRGAGAVGAFIMGHVLTDAMDVPRLTRPLWEAYVARGMLVQALTIVTSMGTVPRPGLEAPVVGLMEQVFRREEVPWEIARQIVKLANGSGVTVPAETAVKVLHAYGKDTTPKAPLEPRDWAFLLSVAVDQEIIASNRPKGYAFQGLASLLQDMAAANIGLTDMPPKTTRRVVKTLYLKQGADELRMAFARLGPKFVKVLDDPDRAIKELATAATSPPTQEEVQQEQQTPVATDAEFSSVGSEEGSDTSFERVVVIDKMLSKTIDAVLTRAQTHAASPGSPPATEAYAHFRAALADPTRSRVPTAYVLGKLIQALGRVYDMDAVREAYTVGQTLLQSLEHDKVQQSSAWFAIENSMIVALAHAGDLEAAHIHRMRILEMGGAPNADAYGALILYVKDTTDDTSNAMALFQEAQVHRVAPNQYLYNNIISKLAKARKADYALELFEQMKASGWAKPSSITYGAVIGACARVGDVMSAENLFAEMMAAPNYRPRVPPFNTMMQLYTTTKPNRERALFFYNQLRAANIAPTAYTYKLLMDAYGRLEPVDIATMEQVWQALQADPSVEIQGNHFASLINAYGCVQRNLDKAIAVFNAIPNYPNAPVRDALVFEAMINALVAHRRTDLMPEYTSLMQREGVHMTAYIANFLIKGYADVGDMDQARAIFESLVDPPSGVAAVNNHAPHEPGMSPIVDPMEPVYREPSTWEVMVRAELGVGNRENANALLARLHARCYPEAVYNRISGILIDHSQVLT